MSAPVTAEMLVQAFGAPGLFIAYLVWSQLLDRKERELRRAADVKLARALDRFCQRFVGHTLPEDGEDV